MKRYLNTIKTLLLLGLFFWVCAPAAMALVREGRFQVNLIESEYITWETPLNDGYQSTWYKYPQPANSPVPPPWWNEWWYDDPYVVGGKWVQIKFDYKLINPEAPGDVFVTINWTNGQWVGQDTPPVPDGTYNPEVFIERLSDPIYNWNLDNWKFHLNPQSPAGTWDSGRFLLPINYNPEWVSVDVQGMGNVGIYNGVLYHECVPEPATLLLMVFGGIGLLTRKR